jgi:hypothetical protein
MLQSFLSWYRSEELLVKARELESYRRKEEAVGLRLPELG